MSETDEQAELQAVTDHEPKPDDVLLAIREFLWDNSLDAIRVDLRRTYYGPGDSLSMLDGGIYLSEEGKGHFCFYSEDLPALAAAAGKIADAGLALRNACLMAVADAAEEAT